MKAKTLQILWHNKEPVLTVDIHYPSGLLATGGADKEIRVWSVEKRQQSIKPQAAALGEKEQPQGQDALEQHKGGPETQEKNEKQAKNEKQEVVAAEYLFSLCHHNYAVNALRFSPQGDMLASGADGGEIALWKWMGPSSEGPKAENNREGEGMAVSATLECGKQPANPNALRGPTEAMMKELGSKGWKAVRNLSRHERDVLDLAWSPDGNYLISGSVDNTAIVWDVARGCPEYFLQDHGHYVQGVGWDPLGAYIVTSSGDRTSRIYTVPFGAPPPLQVARGAVSKPKGGKAAAAAAVRCVQVLHRREVAGDMAAASTGASVEASGPARAEGGGAQPMHAAGATPAPKLPKVYLFHDESMPSFFRRCSWSPDGSLLVLPAGMWRSPAPPDPAGTNPAPPQGALNTCFVFSRSDLSKPLLHLPSLSKPLVAVRFSPVFYALEGEASQGRASSGAGAPESTHAKGVMQDVIKLPYGFVFAVASTNSVSIYTTQHPHPVALLGGLHYAPVTDLAWSQDGLLLTISSQDGYCTVVGFQEGELGVPLQVRGEYQSLWRLEELPIVRHRSRDLPQHIQDAIAPSIGGTRPLPGAPNPTAEAKGGSGMPAEFHEDMPLGQFKAAREPMQEPILVNHAHWGQTGARTGSPAARKSDWAGYSALLGAATAGPAAAVSITPGPGVGTPVTMPATTAAIPVATAAPAPATAATATPDPATVAPAAPAPALAASAREADRSKANAAEVPAAAPLAVTPAALALPPTMAEPASKPAGTGSHEAAAAPTLSTAPCGPAPTAPSGAVSSAPSESAPTAPSGAAPTVPSGPAPTAPPAVPAAPAEPTAAERIAAMIQAAERKLEAATAPRGPASGSTGIQGQVMAGEGGLGFESSTGFHAGQHKGDVRSGVFSERIDVLRTGGVIGVKRSYPEKGDQ